MIQPAMPLSDVILVRNGRGLRLKTSNRWSMYRSAYEQIIHLLGHYVGQEVQWWSRAKAYTNDPLSPRLWGLMKVAGKRLYQLNSDQMDHLWSQLEPHQKRTLPPFSPQEIEYRNLPLQQPVESMQPMFTHLQHAGQWLQDWVQSHNQYLLSKGTGERHTMSRRWGGQRRVVGALALDHSLQPLARQLNQPSLGSTAHAECLLYAHLCRHDVWQKINTLILISSLKPCKMCAGLWTEESRLDRLQVFYLQDDLGPNGQNTAFDVGSYAWEEANKWPYKVESVSQSILRFD